MYAVQFRPNTRRMLCGVGALAVVLGGFLFVRELFPAARAVSASQEAELHLKKADRNDVRVEFLSGLGWEVSPEPVEVQEVVIPLEFDQVYRNYNRLQQEQGFDLAPFTGRRMKRYTYQVFNHPDGEEHVRVNLLVYQKKLVAGDVCSLQLDGFMHGLAFPLP